MEAHLYPAHLIGKDFFTRRSDHNRAQRARDTRARDADGVAVGNLLANTNKAVVVVSRLIVEVVVAALVLDAEQEELAVFAAVVIVVKMLAQLKAVAGVQGAAVAGAVKGLGLGFDGFQAIT
ncbi:hypothetical protein D3C81_1979090 [compost metagenome]